MSTFHLHIDSPLQGEFELKPLNLAFVFQVNCPGCFTYGIPMVNELYRNFKEKIGFIGISTAFEDFDLNTEANTRLLLNEGALVGETKKYFAKQNVAIYPEKLKMPIAFDQLQTPNQFLNHENIEAICKLNPNFAIWPDWEKEELRSRVHLHFSKQELLPKTFTLNQLRGTPSFVIFDENYFVLDSFFGHQFPKLIENKLKDLILTL